MKTYDLSNYTQKLLADNSYKLLRNKGAVIELKEFKAERTSAQNRARWLYLTMVSQYLNEMGITFEDKHLGEIRFTKDLLYNVYWRSAQTTLFEDKKRLNKAEFSQLSEQIMDMFAMFYEVTIPFPDISQLVSE